MVSKNEELTVSEQCRLLEVNRTTLYYKPVKTVDEMLEEEEYIKSKIDIEHTLHCVFGHRKLRSELKRKYGINIGRKKLLRYMKEMNIMPIYPKPNLSKPKKDAVKMPYLLKNLNICRPNQVWAIDITYIKMGRTHMYLTAIIDWNTRFIVGCELSETLDTAPVLKAVRDAVSRYGKPEIINSDQGSQFTSDDYVEFLKKQGIRQSMDGKARWVDNVMIERWFRTLKYELIYIEEFDNPRQLRKRIGEFVGDYNTARPHESLDYHYPAELYSVA